MGSKVIGKQTVLALHGAELVWVPFTIYAFSYAYSGIYLPEVNPELEARNEPYSQLDVPCQKKKGKLIRFLI